MRGHGWMKQGGRIFWGAVCVLALPGCLFLPIGAPPFNATGAYSGTWEGTDSFSNASMSCSLEITLTQPAGASFPGNYQVKGTATFHWACDSVQEAFLGSLLPAKVSFPVSGYMLPSGTLNLGGEYSGAAAKYKADISASGANASNDSTMDTLQGSLYLEVNPAPGRIRYIRGSVNLTRKL